MKNNQPVTQREYPVRDNCSIISHTDAKGRITYVNDDFVEYAGFTREELIGQAHNIIRHPDMPPEAFRDMWTTLKADRAWQGMVKNRRKDGDHYWVKATATPRADGGYMSVRMKPTRAEVEQAEALYRAMREGSGHRLDAGEVIAPGLRGRMGGIWRGLGNLSLVMKVMLPLLIGASLATGVFAWQIGELESVASSPAALRDQFLYGAGAVMAIILTLIVVLWSIAARQSTRLEHVREIASKIAGGDLTAQVPVGRGDNVGAIFNGMQIMRNRLFEIAFELNKGSDRLGAAAKELTESSDATARGARQQSEAASSMAAAVEQLSVSVDHVEANAGTAHSVSVEAGTAAATGAEVVHNAAAEIARIAEAVDQASTSLAELEGISGEIGNIVATIRDIADQTNLLALNAAIEAARAGEQGRGFAVVADEVRKLAERTATSTHEISNMVGRIQNRTKQAVGEMQLGVQRVTEGVQAARDAGDSVAAIRPQTERVVVAAAEIREALGEQASAAREVARSVEQIAQMAEANATASSQSHDASQSVARITGRIRELATQFRV
ncbi:MAG TPA: PAS domain-containing methyl-accepting chemotaxis protein [Rhodocyclaceae bacterium]|nr:PAS domain-containing methyl-accepting chemotaxis protein [Rhodocyclaceae bacterium]HRQ47082.1 PAS domain-containing methyl-accepting chemotaxis protein [Rhodocyclaceae bacterium]